MAGYPAKLQELIDTLALAPDRHDRIQLLIDIADRFQSVPETVATRPFDDAHKTPACESEAFVWAVTQADGTLKFHFAVENPQGIAAMALATILDETLSGLPAEQLADLDTEFVYELFGRELSMGKSMGLMGMVAMVSRFAKQALAR